MKIKSLHFLESFKSNQDHLKLSIYQYTQCLLKRSLASVSKIRKEIFIFIFEVKGNLSIYKPLVIAPPQFKNNTNDTNDKNHRVVYTVTVAGNQGRSQRGCRGVRHPPNIQSVSKLSANRFLCFF